METKVCPNCKQKFSFYEVKNVDNHEKRKEPIVCPYCHEVAAEEITHGYFVANKITEA